MWHLKSAVSTAERRQAQRQKKKRELQEIQRMAHRRRKQSYRYSVRRIQRAEEECRITVRDSAHHRDVPGREDRSRAVQVQPDRQQTRECVHREMHRLRLQNR